MKAFVRQHAWFFVAAAGFSLVMNLALLTPSLYMLQVYDRVLPTRSVETLVMLAAIVTGALLLMFALDLVRARLLALIANVFERQVGEKCLYRLFGRGTPLSAQQRSNALRDVNVVRAFFAGPGILSLFDAPWMPIYIGVIFLFSPVLGALALASAGILLLLAWANERSTRAGIEEAQQQAREVSGLVDGVMRHVEVVRAMGMAPALGTRWKRLNGAVQTRVLATQRLGGLVGSLTRFFRQSVQVLMLSAAAWLVIEQKATAGVMIAVTVILGRALSPVEILVGQWKPLVEARAAWRRLEALLASGAEAPTVALPEPSGAMSVENLSYTPPGMQRAVVRNLSVEITAGEVIAIVGPSGSGKSTLARLMLGILAPGAGSVRLDGAALAQWEPARLGACVGYLPQDVALFSGTIAENIARLGAGDSDEVVAAAQRAHAHEMIVRLPNGYDTQIGDSGLCLSGGQRQRVALARALYGEPRIVVLDEPNANLDADGEQALTRAIAGLRERGATVVLITQRTQILSIADRILVMRDGAIERVGLRQERGAVIGDESNVPVLHPA